MIPRLSGRPGGPGRKDPDQQEAAEIFRRFFHVLERLDAAALRTLAEAVAHGAPETKAHADRRRRKAAAARAAAKRGRAAE